MGKASDYGFKIFKNIVVACQSCFQLGNNGVDVGHNMVAVCCSFDHTEIVNQFEIIYFIPFTFLDNDFVWFHAFIMKCSLNFTTLYKQIHPNVSYGLKKRYTIYEKKTQTISSTTNSSVSEVVVLHLLITWTRIAGFLISYCSFDSKVKADIIKRG